MRSTSDPADPLADARNLCEQNGGLVIETESDNVYDKTLSCWRHPQCWKVYRKLPGGRRAFIGKSRNPRQLLRLVRRLTQGGN